NQSIQHHLPLRIDGHNHVYNDQFTDEWDFSAIFNTSFNVREEERKKENYTYVFDFKSKHNTNWQCANAAICQTKKDFYRDIGSRQNWRFEQVAGDIFLVIESRGSKCGRKQDKPATSRIRFECAPSVPLGHPEFMYENEECDYYF